ncbi:uncharacterized protein METZ01_LOCUS35340, partial [marine metagenome]
VPISTEFQSSRGAESLFGTLVNQRPPYITIPPILWHCYTQDTVMSATSIGLWHEVRWLQTVEFFWFYKVIWADRNIKSFLGVCVEVTKTKLESPIRIRKPPLENRHHRSTSGSN